LGCAVEASYDAGRTVGSVYIEHAALVVDDQDAPGSTGEVRA
jgi:hypothetical protein